MTEFSYVTRALPPGASDDAYDRLPPWFTMLTWRTTRLLPSALAMWLCAAITPESRTAMPIPLPSNPVLVVVPVAVRTLRVLAPVVFSSVLKV